MHTPATCIPQLRPLFQLMVLLNLRAVGADDVTAVQAFVGVVAVVGEADAARPGIGRRVAATGGLVGVVVGSGAHVLRNGRVWWVGFVGRLDVSVSIQALWRSIYVGWPS